MTTCDIYNEISMFKMKIEKDIRCLVLNFCKRLRKFSSEIILWIYLYEYRWYMTEVQQVQYILEQTTTYLYHAFHHEVPHT
jgi:hypothetical protein